MDKKSFPETTTTNEGWLQRVKTSFLLHRIDRRLAEAQRMAGGQDAAFALQDSRVEIGFAPETIRVRHLWDGDVHFEITRNRDATTGASTDYTIAHVYDIDSSREAPVATYASHRAVNDLSVAELAREVSSMAHVLNYGHPQSITG